MNEDYKDPFQGATDGIDLVLALLAWSLFTYSVAAVARNRRQKKVRMRVCTQVEARTYERIITFSRFAKRGRRKLGDEHHQHYFRRKGELHYQKEFMLISERIRVDEIRKDEGVAPTLETALCVGGAPVIAFTSSLHPRSIRY